MKDKIEENIDLKEKEGKTNYTFGSTQHVWGQYINGTISIE